MVYDLIFVTVYTAVLECSEIKTLFQQKKIVKATVHTNDIVRNIVSILCASSMTLVACMT